MTHETYPAWVYCPICTNPLKEAVATVEGYCYCSICISDWFRRHDQRVEDRLASGKLKKIGDLPLRDPVTNLPLSTRVVYEVIPLRQAVTGHREDVRDRELVELRAQVQKRKHYFLRRVVDDTPRQ